MGVQLRRNKLTCIFLISFLFYFLAIPDNIPSELAAPLLCAGVTVYGPLKRYVTRPDMKIGIVGIGGLGHLAIQFASKMNGKVVAISNSPSKKDESIRLGADDFCVMKDEEDKSTNHFKKKYTT